MESMQCLSELPSEQKMVIFICCVYCLFSIPIVFGLLHQNDKLKTILKYKEFMQKGSDK